MKISQRKCYFVSVNCRTSICLGFLVSEDDIPGNKFYNMKLSFGNPTVDVLVLAG